MLFQVSASQQFRQFYVASGFDLITFISIVCAISAFAMTYMVSKKVVNKANLLYFLWYTIDSRRQLNEKLLSLILFSIFLTIGVMAIINSKPAKVIEKKRQ